MQYSNEIKTKRGIQKAVSSVENLVSLFWIKATEKRNAHL